MLAIVLENAPPRLRGRLAVWLLEVGAAFMWVIIREGQGDDLGAGSDRVRGWKRGYGLECAHGIRF